MSCQPGNPHRLQQKWPIVRRNSITQRPWAISQLLPDAGCWWTTRLQTQSPNRCHHMEVRAPITELPRCIAYATSQGPSRLPTGKERFRNWIAPFFGVSRPLVALIHEHRGISKSTGVQRYLLTAGRRLQRHVRHLDIVVGNDVLGEERPEERALQCQREVRIRGDHGPRE
jgi:hypothetical protein